jgi:hypothetical protein
VKVEFTVRICDGSSEERLLPLRPHEFVDGHLGSLKAETEADLGYDAVDLDNRIALRPSCSRGEQEQ